MVPFYKERERESATLWEHKREGKRERKRVLPPSNSTHAKPFATKTKNDHINPSSKQKERERAR